MSVAVGHVCRRVPDVVADLFERAAGRDHQRHVRVPALVQPDRLELERLTAQKRADNCRRPRSVGTPTHVRRRERLARATAEQEIVPAAAGPRDVLEQDPAKLAGERDTPRPFSDFGAISPSMSSQPCSTRLSFAASPTSSTRSARSSPRRRPA